MDPYKSNIDKEKKSAALAQILFLTNITVLPVFSFVILLFLYNKTNRDQHSMSIQHYRQSILANIVAGILLIAMSTLILVLGSFDSIYTWMWLILYFTCIHSMLILFGVFALIKAQTGQAYVYPVFGKLWI